MKVEYVNEGEPSPEFEKLLSDLRDEHSVHVIDASDWSEEERWNYYLDKLVPISVAKKKRLRGAGVRTRKAGSIHFHDLVVLDDRDFFLRNDAISVLRSLEEGEVVGGGVQVV